MRLCPSVDGAAAPLIIHRIGADVCLSRQACHFHKCHRCIYRGKASDWRPEEEASFRIQQGEDPNPADVKRVVIPRPEAEESPRVAAKG